jgi:hypothetical protein
VPERSETSSSPVYFIEFCRVKVFGKNWKLQSQVQIWNEEEIPQIGQNIMSGIVGA